MISVQDIKCGIRFRTFVENLGQIHAWRPRLSIFQFRSSDKSEPRTFLNGGTQVLVIAHVQLGQWHLLHWQQLVADIEGTSLSRLLALQKQRLWLENALAMNWLPATLVWKLWTHAHAHDAAEESQYVNHIWSVYNCWLSIPHQFLPPHILRASLKSQLIQIALN